jgi:Protein of unknown function (DUF2939)
MRRLLLVAGLVMATAGYIAWPLHTAWSIREAVKSGDSAYLARHFEWTPVKATLKESMADLVLGPIDASLEGKPQRQGLWASFKTYYGRNMVDGLVERYATPAGLPTLFSYGRNVRVNVLGRQDPDDGLLLPQRVANAWSRVERASFITPTRFEIDMRDKFEPDRIYYGVLVLKDWRWKVIELRVRQRKSETQALRLTNASSNE